MYTSRLSETDCLRYVPKPLNYLIHFACCILAYIFINCFLYLLFLGEILTATQWMLSIEGQVVMNPHPNFMAGFAALFATYYNFNLVYQHEASCTLEFVQR